MEVSGRILDQLEHSVQEKKKKKNLSLLGLELSPRGFPARSLVTTVTKSRTKKHGVHECSNFGVSLREQY